MKLKSKLFLNYFFLIILFSITLLWLTIGIRELTNSLRSHVRQDVGSVIELSRQFQILEDLNSDFIVLFIPSKSLNQNIVHLEQSRKNFAKNWSALKGRLNQPQQMNWYDNWLHTFYTLSYGLFSGKGLADRDRRIAELTIEVDQQWLSINKALKATVGMIKQDRLSRARYERDAHIKTEIKNLRGSLTKLNQIIGEQGKKNYTAMANTARNTRQIIFVSEILIIIATIIIALLGARRISRPIDDLKKAVQRMAIQDFDVKIKNKPKDEIGDLGLAFEQLSNRLKENDFYKTAMLSQFTHEMKSPLGAIKQATRLLESSIEQPGAEQKRFLSIIKGNNENLQKLITNILHSASYDGGKISLSYASINIVKLMTEVLIYLSPMIKKKEIRVNLNFSAKEITGEFDGEKIKEVLQNLVSNAVKFSSEKSVIDVSISEKFPVIIIKIADRGIGIPKEEVPYIFEKMYRASNSKKISVKGTGLGLYIASQIIRAHGGVIKVDSDLGKGTEFVLTFPRSQKVAREGGWLS